MSMPQPIFLQDILDFGRCSLYALCDSPGRLRDGLPVMLILQYLERYGVQVDLQHVLSPHRRYYSSYDQSFFLDEGYHQDLQEYVRAHQEEWRERDPDAQLSVGFFLERLYESMEKSRREFEDHDVMTQSVHLAVSGPCILLGRLELYPQVLLDEISAVLNPGGFTLEGRIQMQRPEAGGDFWRIVDRYFGLNLPGLKGNQDAAVLRKVILSEQHHRSLLFAYGSSALGTHAAAQLLVAPELQFLLDQSRLKTLFREYRSAEVFVHLDLAKDRTRSLAPLPGAKSEQYRQRMQIRSVRHDAMTHPPFNPGTLSVITTPSPPLVEEWQKWIRWFDDPLKEAAPEEELHYDWKPVSPADGSLYWKEEEILPEGAALVADFTLNEQGYHTGVIGPSPEEAEIIGVPLRLPSPFQESSQSDGEEKGKLPTLLRLPCPWFMVGGQAVRQCVETLLDKMNQSNMQPILLTGPTGTGKEVAANLIYQIQAFKFLLHLAEGKPVWPDPVVLGVQLQKVNCSAITESLAEAEFFGVLDETAHNTRGRPGCMLSAGEGVVFLDELSFLDRPQQSRLLKCLEPPYEVLPVGGDRRERITARIVLAMSENPEQMLDEGRLLPELYSRLQPGLVRIPPLSERVGDIPALLAHLAGGEILIERAALRWLLTHPESLNVRGLIRFVHMAKTIKTDPLQKPQKMITLETVGQQAEYNRLRALLQSASSSPGEGEQRKFFRFHALPTIPAAQNSLQRYLQIFTSVSTAVPNSEVPQRTIAEEQRLNGASLSLNTREKLLKELQVLIEGLDHEGKEFRRLMFSFLGCWAKVRFGGKTPEAQRGQSIVNYLSRKPSRKTRTQQKPGKEAFSAEESADSPLFRTVPGEVLGLLFDAPRATFSRWLQDKKD